MPPPNRPGPSALRGRRRQAVRVSDEQLVTTEPLLPDRDIPVVVRPTSEGVDLLEWAEGHADDVERLLTEHRALLFRGFKPVAASEFESFAKATSEGDLIEYRDRSTPRQTRGDNVYTSTIYPADQRINLHNEGTYWIKWPLKIYFGSIVAAETGGATPIADVSRVFDRIDPEIRQPFVDHGVMYVRNYNDGFGLPWQEVYQTDSRKEVEAYCRANDIEFEWKEGGRLRTRQVRPAIRVHPKTGETVWFNHAAFFHVSALDPTVRERLVEAFGVEGLPYNTYYGDGTPIPDDVVAHLFDAYDEETVAFPWQQGDVMLLNNMTIAHSREPYTGHREVVTAMTEPHSG